MKPFKHFIAALFVVLSGISASAYTNDYSKMDTNMPAVKTETFKVWGNCEMCKARIEKTVKAEGAASADWNTKTKILSVTFDAAKTSVDAFSKKLAAVGHDTDKYKADDKVYNALPACCKYDRKK